MPVTWAYLPAVASFGVILAVVAAPVLKSGGRGPGTKITVGMFIGSAVFCAAIVLFAFLLR